MNEEERLQADYEEQLEQEEEELVETQVEEGAEEEEEEEVDPIDIEDDGRILGLTVHRTDKLKMVANCFIDHPLLRIHLIDMDTGKYLKKTDK